MLPTTRNRFAGLEAAAGEWIAVLDADDAFLPERLEQMLACARDVHADIVVDGFRYYNPGRPARDAIGPPVLDEEAPNSVISFEEYLSRARPYGPETDWGLLKPMFRRAFIEEHRLRYPLKTRHGEDFLFMCETFLHGGRYALCRHAGYLYTSGAANQSRTTRDYGLMYQHTRQLLRDGRIATDPVLVRRLRERGTAVRRLSAESDLAHFRRTHDYNSIAKRALADNTFRKVLAERLVRRLLHIPRQ